MDKYTILILLNVPFVMFGVIHAVLSYKDGIIGRLSLLLRFIFWAVIACGLFFAKYLYNLLTGSNLTDSTPLSLADVILVTGINICLFLCFRLYTKLDHTERRLSELHESVSIILSGREEK